MADRLSHLIWPSFVLIFMQIVFLLVVLMLEIPNMKEKFVHEIPVCYFFFLTLKELDSIELVRPNLENCTKLKYW